MQTPNTPAFDGSARWVAGTVSMGSEILDRMERTVAKVRERLLRAASALERAAIPYAFVGGNAVASWVATVDEGAVRTTRDADILVRREELSAIEAALTEAGFVRDELLDVTIFRDSPEGKPSEAVRLLLAGEKTRSDHALAAPDICTVKTADDLSVITLESLVVMKLMSNRRKDQVHLLGLASVGLIDRSWVSRVPAPLSSRLQTLLDTPDD